MCFTVHLCNLYLYYFTRFTLVWWWYMKTKTVFQCSQTISNKIFRLIPNRPSSVLWRRPRHTCRLEFPVSTHAHYIMIYNSSSQEGKPNNFHCYDFSVLLSVAYLGWLPPASSLHFYLMTLSSSKKYLRSSQNTTQTCFEGRMLPI